MEEYKKEALNDLDNVRYHLSRKYPEWLLPEEICHAVNNAIEGWLKQKGFIPKWGSGIISMSNQLSDIGEHEKSSKVGRIIAEATYLELELTDEDSIFYQNREKNWTIELWKKKIEKLINEAEEFIKSL